MVLIYLMYWKFPLCTNLPSNLTTLDTYLLKALSMSKQWNEFVLTTSSVKITSGWTDYPFTNYPDIYTSEAKATCAVQVLASIFPFWVLRESASFEKIGISLQVFRQSSRIYFLRLFFESLPAVKRRWTSKQLWIKHYDRLSVNILIAQWQVTIYFGHKREVTFNKRVTVNKRINCI